MNDYEVDHALKELLNLAKEYQQPEKKLEEFGRPTCKQVPIKGETVSVFNFTWTEEDHLDVLYYCKCGGHCPRPKNWRPAK